MISIIVSTRKSDTQLARFSENIAHTIGVEHELVVIENDRKYSLCQAYNLGVSRARYAFCCFVHDDVSFETENWGKLLVETMLHQPDLGLTGVAGTQFKSSYPSAWGQSPALGRFKKGHIFHQINGKRTYLEFDTNPENSDFDDVVCLDGVFLFTRKNIVEKCRFDEELLTDFHGYDIDFSLQVYFAGFRAIVDRRLRIVHSSGGSYSPQNTIANRLIARKWKKQLPVAAQVCSLAPWQMHLLDCENWCYFLWQAAVRKLSGR